MTDTERLDWLDHNAGSFCAPDDQEYSQLGEVALRHGLGLMKLVNEEGRGLRWKQIPWREAIDEKAQRT